MKSNISKSKNENKSMKKVFCPKDAIVSFSSFSFICLAIIFSFIVYEVLTIQNLLSFDQPIKMTMNIFSASL